jgi:hypothetical protein
MKTAFLLLVLITGVGLGTRPEMNQMFPAAFKPSVTHEALNGRAAIATPCTEFPTDNSTR